MRELFDFLNQAWLGSLLGLIGVGTGAFFYWMSKVAPKPVYATRSITLIGRPGHVLPFEVTVQFNQKPVPKLTKTTFVFWNAGNATLKGEDIVAVDPVRLEVQEGAQILDARITRQTRSANEVNIVLDHAQPNQMLITYGFLDPQDGAAVELLHSGDADAPRVDGTIRGVQTGFQRWTHANAVPFAGPWFSGFPLTVRTVGVFRASSYVLALVGVTLIVGAGFTDGSLGVDLGSANRIIMVGAGLGYLAYALSIGFRVRNRMPVSLRGGDI